METIKYESCAKKVAVTTVICTVACAFGMLLVHSLIEFGSGPYTYYSIIQNRYVTGYRTWSLGCMIDSLEMIWGVILIWLSSGFIFAAVLVGKSCDLIVTEEGITGMYANGESVYTPIGQILYVENSWPMGVRICASAKSYTFVCLRGRDTLVRRINQFLEQQQDRQSGRVTVER